MKRSLVLFFAAAALCILCACGANEAAPAAVIVNETASPAPTPTATPRPTATPAPVELYGVTVRWDDEEIDLRGMDTMEAVAATERFLDNAVMAKLEKVTIIHGKGTGALRAAVQQSLRKNKAVKSYRLGRYGEGESGVTVVELK